MDDLNRQIEQVLSDPQSLQQLQSMAAALGLTGGQGPPAPDPQPEQPPGLSPELLQAVARAAPLLSRYRQEDDATRLLRALRPLLSEPRRKKLDEALKLLQMMRLMPLLKDSGLVSGLL